MFVRSRFRLLVAVALVLCIVLLWPRNAPVVVVRPQDHAGNSTIGFQQIFALSQRPSWRTRGLDAAANLTGLDITIPPQPPLDNRLAEAFANIEPHLVGAQQPAPGASKAWLAHLDLLKHVYMLDIETALILEDDADWDTVLRQQMQNISLAVRNLTNVADSDLTPYGDGWDVLWLGHCGEQWDDQIETVVFDDIHVNPHEAYHGFWPDELGRLPDLKRAVYWSSSPVCTFAYAVSHEGARKILRIAGAGQDEAFDVKLQHECQGGRLACISVVPEVFHQYFPPPEFDVMSDVDIGNHKGNGPHDEEFESLMGSTENIVYSARCQALWGKQCPRTEG